MLKLTRHLNDYGCLFIFFDGLDDEDDYELIRDILIDVFDYKLLSDQYIVYLRSAELEKNGVEIAFRYGGDSLDGNYFVSQNISDETFLRELGQGVIDYIKANKLLPLD